MHIGTNHALPYSAWNMENTIMVEYVNAVHDGQALP